jgi:hypothetical protein
MSIGLLFLVTGCEEEKLTTQEKQEDTSITEKDVLESYQEFLQSGKTITVQHATLEEINEAMIAQGLEPFSREDIKPSNTRTDPDCDLVEFYGNWNGDSYLSTLDITLATSYITNWDSPPSSGGAVDPTNCCSHPFSAVKFGFLSTTVNPGFEGFRLDQDDIDVVRDYVLGLICYP